MAGFSDFLAKTVVFIFCPKSGPAVLSGKSLMLYAQSPLSFLPKGGQLKASCPGKVLDSSPAKPSLLLKGVRH